MSLNSETRTLIDNLLKIFNEGKTENLDQIFSRDFVRHGPQNEQEVRGPDGYKRMAESYRKLFPDMHTETTDLFQVDDRVVLRFRTSGTHNGRRITVDGANIYRISGGKIAEDWAFYDTAVLSQAVGGQKIAA